MCFSVKLYSGIHPQLSNCFDFSITGWWPHSSPECKIKIVYRTNETTADQRFCRFYCTTSLHMKFTKTWFILWFNIHPEPSMSLFAVLIIKKTQVPLESPFVQQPVVSPQTRITPVARMFKNLHSTMKNFRRNPGIFPKPNDNFLLLTKCLDHCPHDNQGHLPLSFHVYSVCIHFYLFIYFFLKSRLRYWAFVFESLMDKWALSPEGLLCFQNNKALE